MNIKGKIMQLQAGDKIRINDWSEIFTVCGVSENYVLAHYRQEYTIIGKQPTEHQHNGIPVGAYVCAPDNLIFGFPTGYHFKNRAWVEQYMDELESGKIEMSLRNRARIYALENLPPTPERECCAVCSFCAELRHNFKVDAGYEESRCCAAYANRGTGGNYVREVSPWDNCELFLRRPDNEN